MKTYISHKVVQAAKITAAEKEQDGRWHLVFEDSVPVKIPAEDADRFKMTEEDLGYMVVYEGGYTSWSPSKAFEDGYTDITEPDDGINWDSQLDFGMALAFIKEGERLAREGWNGTGMFVFLVDGSTFQVNREPLMSILGEGTTVKYRPHIDLCAADGTIGVWQPSMGDVMAEDWYIVEEAA